MKPDEVFPREALNLLPSIDALGAKAAKSHIAGDHVTAGVCRALLNKQSDTVGILLG